MFDNYVEQKSMKSIEKINKTTSFMKDQYTH